MSQLKLLHTLRAGKGSEAHMITFDQEKPKTLEQKENQIKYIPIEKLSPMSDQPRKDFDSVTLGELCQSIKTYGILQPILVSGTDLNNLTIIAGERRWRAAKLAGLTKIPCILKRETEHSNLELALIENIQREDLSPLDEAESLANLIEDYGYTQEVLSNKLGRNRASISNSLRLLTLPEPIKKSLTDKLITAGHAKALCALDGEKNQLRIHNIVLAKKLSVRQTESIIRNINHEKEPKRLGDRISPDLRYICDQFKGHLGTKVKIIGDTQKGKIEISYYTMDDLERISDMVLGSFGLEKNSDQ